MHVPDPHFDFYLNVVYKTKSHGSVLNQRVRLLLNSLSEYLTYTITMAQVKKNEFRFRQEIAALLCLFFGIFFLFCQVSYVRPLLVDPPSLQDPATNWCGGFGYYVAHYLFSILGITSIFPGRPVE